MNNTTVDSMSDHSEVLLGDLQIIHLWQRQTDTIIDVSVMDTCEKYYVS